jgi:hypothetical protein
MAKEISKTMFWVAAILNFYLKKNLKKERIEAKLLKIDNLSLFLNTILISS